jgi:hypothetical protein
LHPADHRQSGIIVHAFFFSYTNKREKARKRKPTRIWLLQLFAKLLIAARKSQELPAFLPTIHARPPALRVNSDFHQGFDFGLVKI